MKFIFYHLSTNVCVQLIERRMFWVPQLVWVANRLFKNDNCGNCERQEAMKKSENRNCTFDPVWASCCFPTTHSQCRPRYYHTQSSQQWHMCRENDWMRCGNKQILINLSRFANNWVMIRLLRFIFACEKRTIAQIKVGASAHSNGHADTHIYKHTERNRCTHTLVNFRWIYFDTCTKINTC